MRITSRAAIVAGIILLIPSSVFTDRLTAAGTASPEVRLLSLQVFWMDREGSPLAGDAAGVALVPGRDPGRDFYVLTGRSGERAAQRSVRFETIIGTRSSGRFGSVHALNLSRAAGLPEADREEVRRLIGLGTMRGNVYWEGAFELTGLHRDEVRSVEALGPGLIKPPRSWGSLLAAALEPRAEGADAHVGSCLRIGPLGLCMNLPKIVGLLGARRPIKERSRVKVTGSLWRSGDSCGVLVLGRLLDYSVLTFRVRTNGRGSLPAGVHHLAPFELATAPGYVRGGDDGPAGIPVEERPRSPILSARDGRDREEPGGAIASAPDASGRSYPAGRRDPNRFATAPAAPAGAMGRLRMPWSARIWGLSPPRLRCVPGGAWNERECAGRIAGD